MFGSYCTWGGRAGQQMQTYAKIAILMNVDFPVRTARSWLSIWKRCCCGRTACCKKCDKRRGNVLIGCLVLHGLAVKELSVDELREECMQRSLSWRAEAPWNHVLALKTWLVGNKTNVSLQFVVVSCCFSFEDEHFNGWVQTNSVSAVNWRLPTSGKSCWNDWPASERLKNDVRTILQSWKCQTQESSNLRWHSQPRFVKAY